MTAREIALKALYSIEKSGAYTNAALKEALSKEELSLPDKGLVTELIYGIVSNKSAIDYIIMQFSKVKIKKMTPWVLGILRMGIYQIYYMDKIPHSAACNEAVTLAKKYSHGAGAGFVNGVLRSAARACADFKFPVSGDAVRDLSLEYSYPEWITESLIAEYGMEKCLELYKENRKAHNTAIRVNTLKINKSELIEVLEKEGLECKLVNDLDNALIVCGKLNIEKSDAYKKGFYSLQNLSSQKAVEVLAPTSGKCVIDMCAAPGGKSCAIAEKMKNDGKVYSFDIFPHKVELINRASARLGIEIIDTKVMDTAEYCSGLADFADFVLADVPCSGLGVIHKKPDIKWTRTPQDIDGLCRIQTNILKNAARYVKSGGVLVYSTCTILPEENRLRIREFVNENKNFEIVYEEQILTSSMGESGFYICKMMKG